MVLVSQQYTDLRKYRVYCIHMAHPFTKQFERALKKSTVDENGVLTEALKLIGKGYRIEEIQFVLKELLFGRIDDSEGAVIQQAIEQLEEDLGDE